MQFGQARAACFIKKCPQVGLHYTEPCLSLYQNPYYWPSGPGPIPPSWSPVAFGYTGDWEPLFSTLCSSQWCLGFQEFENHSPIPQPPSQLPAIPHLEKHGLGPFILDYVLPPECCPQRGGEKHSRTGD